MWVRADRGSLACWRCAAAALRGRLCLSAVVAAYRGQGAAVRALVDYKERREGWRSLETPLGVALSESVAQVMGQYGLPEDTLVVPVPSYRDRRPHVSRVTALVPGVTRRNALWKVHDIRQTGAGRRQRWEQSQDAYALRWCARVRGRTVIVTDDIYTSGATLTACAAALLAAGAGEVYGATILRTSASPPVLPVVAKKSQIRVRYVAPDPKGRIVCTGDSGFVWLRFACEAHCPRVLTAGPFPLPTAHIDIERRWLCVCGLAHAIQISRHGPTLRVTVPPRRPAELLVALYQGQATAPFDTCTVPITESAPTPM
jgi:predicted amidophosphoribosyltransferase